MKKFTETFNNVFQFVESISNFKTDSFNTDELIKINLTDYILNCNDIENFTNIFKNISFLYYSTNKNHITDLKYHFESKIDLMANVKETYLFSCRFASNSVFFPYMGSKKNHRKTSNSIAWDMFNYYKELDTVFEPFLGAGSLLFDNLEIYYNNNVKEIITNDYNSLISNTYIDVKNNKDEVIKELSLIAYYLKNRFNTFEFDNEVRMKQIKEYVLNEINSLTSKNIFNCKTSALFLYGQHLSVNGMIDYDLEKNIVNWDFSFNKGNNFNKFAFIVNKIEFYNYALNIFNIKILNDDYINLINNYNSKNIFCAIDSPYLDQFSEIIETGGFNYGNNEDEKINFGNGFNQIPLLDFIKDTKSKWMLWNNHHYLLEFFNDNKIITSKYKKFIVNYANSKKESIEIVMYTNNLTTSIIEQDELFIEFLNEYNYLQNNNINCIDSKNEFEMYKSYLISLCRVYDLENKKIPRIAENFYNSTYLIYK